MSATSLWHELRAQRVSNPRDFTDEAVARYDYGWQNALGWIEREYRRLFLFAAFESNELRLLQERAPLADLEFLMSQATSLPFGGFCVYLLFDSKDELLYVGQAKNAWRRIGAHASKSWGDQIDSVRVIRCESRAEALELETRLIREQRPRHNVQGVWRHLADTG